MYWNTLHFTTALKFTINKSDVVQKQKLRHIVYFLLSAERYQKLNTTTSVQHPSQSKKLND